MTSSHTACSHEWQSGGWAPGTREVLPDVCLKCGAFQDYQTVGVVVTTEFESLTDDSVSTP